MKLLENKTTLITGATRGIGKGIAIEFAKQGSNIAFTFNASIEAAKSLENELCSYGIKAKGYQSYCKCLCIFSFRYEFIHNWTNIKC